MKEICRNMGYLDILRWDIDIFILLEILNILRDGEDI